MVAPEGGSSQAWEKRIERISTRPNRITFPDYIIPLYIPSNQLEKSYQKKGTILGHSAGFTVVCIAITSLFAALDKLAHQTGVREFVAGRRSKIIYIT